MAASVNPQQADAKPERHHGESQDKHEQVDQATVGLVLALAAGLESGGVRVVLGPLHLVFDGGLLSFTIFSSLLFTFTSFLSPPLLGRLFLSPDPIALSFLLGLESKSLN